MNATRFLPRRSAAAEQRLRAGAACLWNLTHFRPWYTARVLPLAVRVGSRSTDYHPRIASQTVVHQVVRDHFETFRAQAAGWRNGEGLPRFVEAEFREFLSCGCLAGGFARFRCGDCGLERLVPFWCKARACCASCGGRRMAERAAHPIDHVFPAHADVGSLASTFELLRFVREGVAVGVAVHPLVAAVDASTDSTGTVSNNRVGVGIPFLVRWYPMRRATRRHGLEPYIGAGFGPLVGADVTMFSGGTTSDAGVKATVAGLAQVGIDFRVGRVVLGASGGYNWSGRVPNRDSSFTRYSGAEVSFGIGIVMGKPAIR